MPKYRAYGVVTGTKYLGVFEAETKEEAEEAALNAGGVHLCHQCCSECEDPEIQKVSLEECD